MKDPYNPYAHWSIDDIRRTIATYRSYQYGHLEELRKERKLLEELSDELLRRLEK